MNTNTSNDKNQELGLIIIQTSPIENKKYPPINLNTLTCKVSKQTLGHQALSLTLPLTLLHLWLNQSL